MSRGPTKRVWAALLLGAAAAGAVGAGCEALGNSEVEAPLSEPALKPGKCGTTSDLLPKLLSFLDAGGLEPLKQILEGSLSPSEDEPYPDPSLRVVFNALVRLVNQLGLKRASIFADFAGRVGLTGEFVQHDQLGSRVRQLLVFVLAVDVDQMQREVLQLLQGDRRAVDECA